METLGRPELTDTPGVLVLGSSLDEIAQRLQNPSIKEYTLNHIRNPIII